MATKDKNNYAGSVIPLETYPGRKGAAGVWQTIVSEIPKCKIFVDAMCGSGIIASKVQADTIVLNDLNDVVITQLEQKNNHLKHVRFTNYSYEKLFSVLSQSDGVVFYFDPPYLFETRQSKLPLYRHEWNENDHARFLSLIIQVKKPVLISHYPCNLYDTVLKDWRIIEYEAMTHTGMRKENLYMNFKAPLLLQNWQHVGENFTDRQRIKRKITRLINSLKNETEKERAAIITAVVDEYSL